MNTIDVVSKWIIKMFKFNARETGGLGCQFYENGIGGDLVGIQIKELVFGVAKIDRTSYYFTEDALLIGHPQSRIGWNEVASINGSFRSGHEIVSIQMKNGSVFMLPMAKFPYRIQQLVYQLIERHSATNLLPRFLGPQLIRESFEKVDAAFYDRMGMKLDRFDVVFRVPLSNKNAVLLYQGNFNDKEKFIYPTEGVEFIVGWKVETKWIPLLISTTQNQSNYSSVEKARHLLSELKTLPMEIPEVICHYIYAESDKDNRNESKLYQKSEVVDSNEHYSSVVIYFVEEGKLRKLTECEVD